MDSNELRALADALEFGPLDSRSTPPLLARKRAAAYLRAQAEAQPTPAVPQAEPDDDDDALVLGEPDILTPEDIRRLVPQAEPKREPLSDTMVIACARVAIARIQPDEWVATDADLIDFARAIESEHGIGGSDAE